MNAEVLLSGLLAGYGVAVPVGAIGALIVSLAARAGWRTGAAAALGVAAADGIYAVIAVVGGAALAGLIAPISTPLRWAAAVVLLFLAVRTAAAALRPVSDTTETPPGNAFLSLLGLTMLNPATIVYFGALVLGSGGDMSASAATLWVAAAVVASASWQLFLAGAGTVLGTFITGPRGRRWTALTSGAVIAVLAIRLVV